MNWSRLLYVALRQKGALTLSSSMIHHLPALREYAVLDELLVESEYLPDKRPSVVVRLVRPNPYGKPQDSVSW